jgi:hypothetical protein
MDPRFAEGFSLSEFRIKNDTLVFGLPNEALLYFGSGGIGTFGNLEFSSPGESYSLHNTVADILVTLDEQVGKDR